MVPLFVIMVRKGGVEETLWELGGWEGGVLARGHPASEPRARGLG